MPAKINPNSDDQLNEEINDKLSQLWGNMKGKKQQLIRNLTPHYSRRTEHTNNSEMPLNISHPQNVNTSTHSKTQENSQLYRMREKLLSQASARKDKECELQKLRKKVKELTNDKKILLTQLKQMHDQSLGPEEVNQNISYDTNYLIESEKVDGRTAMFSTAKKCKNRAKNSTKKSNKLKKTLHFTHTQKNKENQEDRGNICKEDSRTYEEKRLLQLLKSTSEYREFAFYYDCHELSYLKKLEQQHRKNCVRNLSQIEKRLWAPTQLLQAMEKLNREQKLGLTQSQIEIILSEMKEYYEAHESFKIKKVSETWELKLKKLERQMQNSIPYDIVRLQNVRKRQNASRKKRINSSCLKV